MKRQRHNEGIESLDMENWPTMLPQRREIMPHPSLSPEVIECKTCNRKFSSFGGHRRPKLDWGELRVDAKSLTLGMDKPRTQDCSICDQEFSPGQPLGAHTRRHRSTINEGFPSINRVVAKVSILKRLSATRVFYLDLNLTPLENDLKLLLFGKTAPKVHLSSF